MTIYVKNNPAKFHPDPVWIDGAVCFFFEAVAQQQKEQDE